MDHSVRELLVARICSGTVRLHLPDTVLILKRPAPQYYYLAQEIYQESLHKAALDGLYNDLELFDFLVDNDIWDEKSQELMSALPKEIEDFKVALYKAAFKGNERKTIKTALVRARSVLDDLNDKRSSYDHYSCRGMANFAKFRFLIGCSLHYQDGLAVFSPENFWDQESKLLDESIKEFNRCRLSESDIRDVARNEPWRGIWSSRETDGLFGIPSANYTDEQKVLVSWSQLYDNIYEHSEAPSQEVINDDDMLDGWLIEQRRKREKVKTADVPGSEKVKNSQEVFVVAETLDDARKVLDLNDEMGKHTLGQRFKKLREKGKLQEAEMPDTSRKIKMMINSARKG